MTESAVESSSEVVVGLTEKELIQVLHVDDEAGFLKVAKQILEMQGAFEVDTAVSVEEAIEKMKEKAYDAIVCDYIMPRKDGLQFLKELRNSGNNTPFIIFTGKGREDVAIEALNLGADRYFSKIGGPETVYGELAYGIRRTVERKRAVKEVWRREQRLRAILASSPDIITVSDLQGKIVDCNEAAWKLTGFSSKEELLGKSSFEFIAEKDRKKALEHLKKTLTQGTVRNVEYTLLNRDGEEYIGELSASILKDSSGNPIGFVGIVRDITERKKSEEELKKSEEKYRSLFGNARDVIVLMDLKGNVTSINKAAVEYGFNKDEFIGRNMRKFVPKRYWPRLFKELVQLARGKTVKGEIEIVTPKGKKIASYRSNPIIIDNRVVGVQTVLTDITEHKKAEDALRESEGKLNAMLNSIGDHMSMMDRNLNILWANETAKKIFGNDIIGKKCYRVYHRREKPCEPYPCLTLKTFQDGNVHEHDTQVIDKDGKIICFHCTANVALRDKEGKPTAVIEISRDITERKKAEEALKESEDKFRSMVEATSDWLWEVDKNGVYTYVSPKIKDVLGYEPKEIIGKTPFDLMPKDEAEKIGKIFGEIAKKKKSFSGLENWNVHKNGTKVMLETSGIPILDEKRNLTGYRGIDRDITERKKAEKAILESQEKMAVMNEKLGVVGKLTRHDSRNKLSAVTMNAFLAKQKLAGDHEVLEHLSQIESACGEVERIFEFARIYEKIGVEELAYMDVEKTLEETIRLFSDLHGAKVVNDCKGLTVLADSLLRQLLYNLIDNSLKHGGNVSQIRVHYEEMGKDQLKLIYEDDGVGIPMAEKKKIFLEGYGRDTSYGLYLIKKMCDVYGWSIRETGKHDKGAEFTITIPETGEKGKILCKLQK